MFDYTYHTIAGESEGIYKEKGSKFIALAYPVKTEEDVKQHVAEVKKKYYDARHHCYAYILGPNKDAYRLNDDGEPSGTAGRPIHGQLLSKDVTDTLIIVVRYFGGTTTMSTLVSPTDCICPKTGGPDELAGSPSSLQRKVFISAPKRKAYTW